MTLYNLRTDGDQYRITKFTDDLNVESSYLMTHTECECPAGSRPSCRHRNMFWDLLPIVDTEFFWNFDIRQVVDFKGYPKAFLDNITAPEWLPDHAKPPGAAISPLPAGVIMVSLDEPAALHNAIATAVGEPEAILPPAPSWRRL